MKNIYLNKLFFGILVFLILNSIFVFAAENYTDYGKDFGLDYELKGYGTTVGSVIQTKNTFISFNREDSKVIIKGEVFENIQVTEPLGTLEFAKDGEILNAKFLVNEKGGFYTLGGTKFYAPPNSYVEYNKKENKLFVSTPKNSIIKELPSSKDSNSMDVQYDGDNLKLPDGNVFSGKLYLDNRGNGFVYGDEIKQGIEINNLRLISSDSVHQKVSLFFDGKVHENNFVSFGKENLILSSENSAFGIYFKEGNSYVKIDNGDHVAIKIGEKSSFELEVRNSENMIPKVLTKGDNVLIEQDEKKLTYNNGEVLIGKSSFSEVIMGSTKYRTTSPMELFNLGDHEVIVDNFNRFAVVNVKDFQSSDQITSLYEEIPTTFSRRISYNYPDEMEVGKLVGKPIVFYDIEQGNKDFVLGRLRDYISSVSPESRDSLGSLHFLGNADFDSVYGKNYDAIMFPGNGNIIFRANSLFGSEQFDHEFGHLIHFKYRSSEIEKDPVLSKEFKDIDRGLWEVGSEVENIEKQIIQLSKDSITAPVEDTNNIRNKINNLNLQLEKQIQKQGELMLSTNIILNGKIPIENEWKMVAGEYGVAPVNQEQTVGGFLTLQARQGVEEDIASFFQKSENPSFFKPLLDPKNPDSVIYRKKLDLAYKIGLPRSRYEAILIEAGLKN